MAPTPKETGHFCRCPIELFFQQIDKTHYQWLSRNLNGKETKGLLIDWSPKGGMCVHLIVGWEREGRSHREVVHGDDFNWAARLSEQSCDPSSKDIGYWVDWGGTAGRRFYKEKLAGYVTLTDYPWVLSNVPRPIYSFSFSELEEGFLRAAGRLPE